MKDHTKPEADKHQPAIKKKHTHDEQKGAIFNYRLSRHGPASGTTSHPARQRRAHIGPSGGAGRGGAAARFPGHHPFLPPTGPSATVPAPRPAPCPLPPAVPALPVHNHVGALGAAGQCGGMAGGGGSAQCLSFAGCNFLRQRLVLSTLSGRPLKIRKIRAKEEDPGLRGERGAGRVPKGAGGESGGAERLTGRCHGGRTHPLLGPPLRRDPDGEGRVSAAGRARCVPERDHLRARVRIPVLGTRSRLGSPAAGSPLLPCGALVPRGYWRCTGARWGAERLCSELHLGLCSVVGVPLW